MKKVWEIWFVGTRTKACSYLVLGLAAGTILYFASEHTKNKRQSTKGKHEKGRARQEQDRSGSKGMKEPPRKRPDGWKGPWPPK